MPTLGKAGLTVDHATDGDAPAALAAARAWIGTPYMIGQALRGVGCDCVGLVRGVWSDVTGRPAPDAPPFRADWHNAPGRPLVAAARAYLDPVALSEARPGDVVVLRVQGSREAHCGILETDGQIIHAVETVGVVRVPFEAFRPGVTFCARFPSA